MNTPVFGITGWKNSGKTTMTCALVAEFTRRGFRVATVKHAHHAFEVDHQGTDSHRHRLAGAGEVAVISRQRWAIMHELRDDAEPSLAEILNRLSPCDLVLIEGYKREAHRKLEVRRLAAVDRRPLAAEDAGICAIAADHDVPDANVPVFGLDDISAIADLIAAQTGLKENRL